MRHLYKFFLFLLVPAGSFAQNASEVADSVKSTKHQIHFQPLMLEKESFNISYERDFNETFSANITTGFFLGTTLSTRKTGFNSELQLKKHFIQYRIFPHNKLNIQLFSGPFIQYSYYQMILRYAPTVDIPNGAPLTNKHIIDKVQQVTVGLIAGIKFTIHDSFVVNAYAGPAYRSAYYMDDNIPRHVNIFTPYYSGFYPKAGLQIGILF